MYNATTLKEGILPLIGWRQNQDPDGWQLATLNESSSGLWYNDEHPLLTFDNLVSIAPQFEVIHAGDEAAQEEAFEAWLQEKTEAAIVRAVQAWIDTKFEVNTARNLLERKQLFATAPSIEVTDANAGKLVGFEFRPARTRGIKLVIEKIGLQLTENQSLTVYLFKSDTVAPVQTKAITYNGNGGQVWEEVNWELDGEGAYYVAYFQNTLTGLSIRGALDYDFQARGQTFFPVGRFFRATAFASGVASPALWDIRENVYTVSTNYGLNFRLNVQCDYTDFVIEQKQVFKTLIAKQTAMDLLREMAYNPNSRVNRNETNFNSQQILYEIDGDPRGREGGVRSQFEKALKTLNFDTKGLDRHCLPCRQRSVRYGVI